MATTVINTERELKDFVSKEKQRFAELNSLDSWDVVGFFEGKK